MKGSASQPHHTCRREEGKRSAQAGGQPTAGDVRDRSRMAATRYGGAGRSPQSPTAVRRDVLGTEPRSSLNAASGVLASIKVATICRVLGALEETNWSFNQKNDRKRG